MERVDANILVPSIVFPVALFPEPVFPSKTSLISFSLAIFSGDEVLPKKNPLSNEGKSQPLSYVFTIFK